MHTRTPMPTVHVSERRMRLGGWIVEPAGLRPWLSAFDKASRSTGCGWAITPKGDTRPGAITPRGRFRDPRGSLDRRKAPGDPNHLSIRGFDAFSSQMA